MAVALPHKSAETVQAQPAPPTIDELDMTLEARRARAEWRREHPEAWLRDLKALANHDPEFVYSPDHEYDADSTTDPDYEDESLDLVDYDADGVVSPWEKRAIKIQEGSAAAASAALAETGLTGDYERHVRFRPDTIAEANRLSETKFPLDKKVRPDMMVRADLSPEEADTFMPKGVWRIDHGAPVPPLGLEVVSKGEVDHDLVFKRHLYACAGVSEYLAYDLGGKRWTNSPRELLMFRLVDGTYHLDDTAEEYWSDVFETWVRVLPNELEKAEVAADVPEEDRTPPIFQYLDITEQRWRDAASDQILKARTEERLSQILDALHTFLGPVLDADCLEEIEVAWSEHGPPDEAMAGIREAMLTPSEWRQLLPPYPVTETEGDDTPAGRQTI